MTNYLHNRYLRKIVLSKYQSRVSPDSEPPDFSPQTPKYRKTLQSHRDRYHTTLRILSYAIVGMVLAFLFVMGMGLLAITGN